MERKPIAAGKGRSSQYHVVGGLRFLDAFGRGDMDVCTAFLHPDVEWHPTPHMHDHEAVRGRDAVRYALEAVRDRFEGLAVEPEDGRQAGDYVLLISLMRGTNAFHGGEQAERACWVITVADELWKRVVIYGNPAWARMGFDELLAAARDGTDPDALPVSPDPLEGGADPFRGDRLTLEVEQSTAAQPAQPATAGNAPSGGGGPVALELTFEEAEALARWLVKASQDGAAAIDDPAVKPGLMKLRAAVEREQAVRNVRKELEQAGIQTQHLSDAQVVQLGRRISAVAAPAIKPGE